MTIEQQSFLNMSAVLRAAIVGIDPVVLSSIPNFAAANSSFNSRTSTIAALYKKQSLDSSGNELTKKEIRTKLIVFSLDLCAKMISYAGSIRDYVLLNEVSFNKTKLTKQTEFSFTCSCAIIARRAAANLPALIPYGLTAAVLADYDALRERFRVVQPLPISGRTTKKEATSGIEREIENVKNDLLVMDRAIETVKSSDSVLYKKYFNARKINKPPRRMLAARGIITDPEGNPLPSVRMTCVDLNIKRRVSKKGTFFIKTGSNGKFQVIYERAGYETVVKEVAFFRGTRVELHIIMNRL